MSQVYYEAFSMHFSFNSHKYPESGMVLVLEILERSKGQLKWGNRGEFEVGTIYEIVGRVENVKPIQASNSGELFTKSLPRPQDIT